MDELISSDNWMEMEGKMGGSICTDTLRITPEILKLIAEVEHLLAGLDVQQSLRALTSLTVNHQVNFTI